MEKTICPSAPDDLYEYLRASDNPTEAASDLFETGSFSEDARLSDQQEKASPASPGTEKKK